MQGWKIDRVPKCLGGKGGEEGGGGLGTRCCPGVPSGSTASRFFLRVLSRISGFRAFRSDSSCEHPHNSTHGPDLSRIRNARLIHGRPARRSPAYRATQPTAICFALKGAKAHISSTGPAIQPSPQIDIARNLRKEIATFVALSPTSCAHSSAVHPGSRPGQLG